MKKNRSARRPSRRSKPTSSHTDSNKNKTEGKTAKQMPPPLKEVCDELRALVRKADVNDAKARYEIGTIVLRVLRDKNNTYGAGAVETLAKELAYDDSSLRDYADVAKTWPKATFEKLLERKSSRGVPLPLSHFIVLARVADEKKRDAWLEQALRDGLPVRGLQALVKQNAQASTNESTGEQTASNSSEKRLRESVAHWEGEASQLRRQTELVIHLAQKSPTPRVQELVRKCAENQRALAKTASEAAAKLEAFLNDPAKPISGHPEFPAVANG